MAISRDHSLHSRRFSRNMGVGLALTGLVVLIFALTVVKMNRGDSLEAFDHSPRNSVLVEDQ
jgi:hypothetical protein